MITNNIESLRKSINDSLEWVKEHRPDDYGQKFMQLVENRRILDKIYKASANNPGIAAFGKSQVGKSYMISCLLQDKDKPFMVKTRKGDYNFIYQINPPSEEGGGRESTSVVTRFSSFSRSPKPYSIDYPVLVKTFSVSDIVTIIADSYFKDFYNCTPMRESEIAEIIESYRNRYSKSEQSSDSIVSADDILNMKEYFAKHLNQAQVFIITAFFENLAMYIENIPVEDYASVFSVLWNGDEHFTMLFSKLLNILRDFKFSEYIYLPIEAVVHNDIKEDTIMSVRCLSQLLDSTTNYTTDVYIENNGEWKLCKSGVAKSHICAVCSEVVFKIEKEFLNSSSEYCLDEVPPEVSSKITRGEIMKDILNSNDLLDFPGARAREQEDVAKLSIDSTIINSFLRGKVAYLFNKYNAYKTINILLYCHHNKDNDVTELYKLLQDWVEEYVGNTPKARMEKLQDTQVSPLFFIGTMFNIDMQIGVGSTASDSSIDQRWVGRFDTVVNKQCFHTETVEWVNNWTDKGVGFQNSYVLRDFKYSTKSSLYSGFEETGEERDLIMDRDYYRRMRSSFINNSFVKKFFKDPDVSWDLACSLRNDGSLYIIENLSKVAKRMERSREIDFESTVTKVREKVYRVMKDYFISTDIEEILDSNAQKAKAIFREMDFTCNADNYYFGHLLQALQVTEPTAYKVVHSVMQGPEINSMVNAFKDYEIIRSSCKKSGFPMEQVTKDSEKWECIINTYGFSSRDEAEEFLAKKNIDVVKLFDGNYKRKMNSCIIGDAVFDKWVSSIKSVEFFSEFSNDESFDDSIMPILVDNLIATANVVNLRDLMSEAIAEYVNVVNIHTANENLLADILASLVNDFVLDFGYKYLTADEIANAETLCRKKNIPAFDYINKDMSAVCTEEDLTRMFNEMSANPKALLPSFEDNYNKWLEYMFISFVAHLSVPDYDYDANKALADILDNIKNEA